MRAKVSFRVLLPMMLVLAFSPVFNGCALLLVGGGAAGGYAASKDEIEGAVDSSYSRVYKSAVQAAQSKGIIKLQDEQRGYIETMVDANTVKIHISQITNKTVKLRVEARNKYKMPKIAIAQDIYTEIMKKVG